MKEGAPWGATGRHGRSTTWRELTGELSAPVGLKPVRGSGPPVSLSELQCQQVNKLDGIEERSVAGSEGSADSGELSEDAASEVTEFDVPRRVPAAQPARDRQRKGADGPEAQAFLLDELEETQAAASSAPSRLAINSDSAFRRLMEVPLRGR
eukprot:Skav216458  [mRNA]  locus=scaffold50:765858:771800:- [translate_table: standard]